ncbi:MAG TPA: hypothetical protein VGL95_16455, partial [Acetobacteraceae bacterium]
FASKADLITSSLPGQVSNNSQISSFGIGKIFIHCFSCPNWKVVADFETSARARGLTQIWPIPAGIWPFPKRATKFPPKLTLTDEEADVVAEAFYNLLQNQMGTKANIERRFSI